MVARLRKIVSLIQAISRNTLEDFATRSIMAISALGTWELRETVCTIEELMTLVMLSASVTLAKYLSLETEGRTWHWIYA
jgi:hypothetical protein